jgi:hypothetical protein
VDAANGHSNATDVASDAAGNTYLAGTIAVWASDAAAGPIDLDPDRSYDDSRDIVFTEVGQGLTFFAKYLPDGSLDWVNTADRAISSVSVATAPSGGIYFAGTFGALSINFCGTTITRIGNSLDRVAGKLNADGSLAWVKAFDVAFVDKGGGIAVDEARGRMFITGSQLLSNQSYESGVVVALNIANAANVYVAWTADLVATGSISSHVGAGVGDVVVDSSGNIIAAAGFAGSADFNPGSGKLTLSSSSGTKGMSSVIWKLSGSGALISAQQFEPANNSGYSIRALAIDAANNLFVAGSFTGTVDFQAGKSILKLASAGAGDAFLVKISSVGTTNFAQRYGGVTDDYATGVSLDVGGAYLVGVTRDTTGKVTNTFVNKYDATSGALAWQFLLYGQFMPETIVSVNPATGRVWLVGRYFSLDTDGDTVADVFMTDPIDNQPEMFFARLVQG